MHVTESIEKAADVMGSQEKLAGLFGLQKAAVTHWKRAGCVPAEYCPEIERASGGVVSCENLCPEQAWVRVKDKKWPHAAGRPLVDHSTKQDA